MDDIPQGHHRGQLRSRWVRVRESEKVLMEASQVIGEVQRYWEALYAKRPVNLPAYERLVWVHIPRGVPDEWR